jgi:hypothetical protein
MRGPFAVAAGAKIGAESIFFFVVVVKNFSACVKSRLSQISIEMSPVSGLARNCWREIIEVVSGADMRGHIFFRPPAVEPYHPAEPGPAPPQS